MWPSSRVTPSQPSRYATDTAELLIAANLVGAVFVLAFRSSFE